MSELIDRVIGETDYGKITDPNKPKYSPFEMECFADLQAMSDLEAILPQVYLSLQHQLRDPKLPQELRKTLTKRALALEKLITPSVDQMWKITSKKTYEKMVEILEQERHKLKFDDARKKFVEKLE